MVAKHVAEWVANGQTKVFFVTHTSVCAGFVLRFLACAKLAWFQLQWAN